MIARWTARAGEEERVAGALAKMLEPSRAEAGCLVYVPHRLLADPTVFVLYEEYVDEAAYEAHMASEHFRRHALEEAIPLLASREREFLTSL